jgi:hypothetical protein
MNSVVDDPASDGRGCMDKMGEYGLSLLMIGCGHRLNNGISPPRDPLEIGV